MTDQIRQSIEIACSPKALYDYVTQPWCWHEWHPNSRSAKAAASRLSVGDHFDEIIELQPLSPLPFTLMRETRYEVVVAEPDSHWRVEGEMAGGWLQIDYRFEPSATGVLFTRTLTYEARGSTRILAPFLKSRMRAMSSLALNNLKAKMESAPR